MSFKYFFKALIFTSIALNQNQELHNSRANKWCSAEIKDEIARVRIDSETGQFPDISLFEKDLRFKCKRCAIYCCKRGGPFLTKADIAQIEFVGYKASEFVEDSKKKYGKLLMTSAMKNREDGSCVFLRLDEKRKAYECSICEIRPMLCRLFPLRLR